MLICLKSLQKDKQDVTNRAVVFVGKRTGQGGIQGGIPCFFIFEPCECVSYLKNLNNPIQIHRWIDTQMGKVSRSQRYRHSYLSASTSKVTCVVFRHIINSGFTLHAIPFYNTLNVLFLLILPKKKLSLDKHLHMLPC